MGFDRMLKAAVTGPHSGVRQCFFLKVVVMQ
jgi:hypothetical protein